MKCIGGGLLDGVDIPLNFDEGQVFEVPTSGNLLKALTGEKFDSSDPVDGRTHGVQIYECKNGELHFVEAISVEDHMKRMKQRLQGD